WRPPFIAGYRAPYVSSRARCLARDQLQRYQRPRGVCPRMVGWRQGADGVPTSAPDKGRGSLGERGWGERRLASSRRSVARSGDGGGLWTQYRYRLRRIGDLRGHDEDAVLEDSPMQPPDRVG